MKTLLIVAATLLTACGAAPSVGAYTALQTDCLVKMRAIVVRPNSTRDRDAQDIATIRELCAEGLADIRDLESVVPSTPDAGTP